MDWKTKTCELGNEGDTTTRFKNWLLEMGFPCSVPREYLTNISRGNYRVVWENLMKHVESRDEIRNKRTQLFVASINHCESFEDNLHERIGACVTCEELQVWRDTQELQKLINEAEQRVASSKHELLSLTTFISDKVAERETLNRKTKETRRMSYALQRATEQLQTRADKLEEMINITDQLSPITVASISNSNMCASIEKSFSIAGELALKRLTNKNNQENAIGINKFNSTTLSNVSSMSEPDQREQDTYLDAQNQILQLLEGIGLQNIWSSLNKAQDELIQNIFSRTEAQLNISHNTKETAQYITASTSALHSKLCLRTLDMKNRISSLKNRLIDVMRETAIDNDDEAARELLVLVCEETAQRGRVSVLQEQLLSIQQRQGEYNLPSYSNEHNNIEIIMANIVALDRELVSKKAEIENLLISMEVLGSKITSAAGQLESLSPVHNAVSIAKQNNHETSMQGNYAEFVRHFRPNEQQSSMSLQIAKLREFYTPTCTEYKNLSLNLDCSIDSEKSMNGVPCLSEELKCFMEKFNINENRKLILHSGESLWISEKMDLNKNTYNSAAHEISLVAFNVREYNNLSEIYPLKLKEPFGWYIPSCVDVQKDIEKNSSRLEYIKKLARDSLSSLQQISTHLDIGAGNLRWWTSNQPGLHMNKTKLVFDKTYHFYHSVYVECMKRKAV